MAGRLIDRIEVMLLARLLTLPLESCLLGNILAIAGLPVLSWLPVGSFGLGFYASAPLIHRRGTRFHLNRKRSVAQVYRTPVLLVTRSLV